MPRSLQIHRHLRIGSLGHARHDEVVADDQMECDDVQLLPTRVVLEEDEALGVTIRRRADVVNALQVS